MSATAAPGAGRGAALLGGLLALAATILLPFHVGGGLGLWVALLYLPAGILLALASRRWADRAGVGKAWAVVGGIGFAVSGLGLALDVVERPIVTAEIAAVAATAAWWVAAGWRRARAARWFRHFSLLCGLVALAALLGQVVWEPPAGAVPARFAYVLWGPWGLWLAFALGRARALR